MPWYKSRLRHIKARAELLPSGEMIVEKGSTASAMLGTLLPSEAQHRQRLIAEGFLAPHPDRADLMIFHYDAKFASETQAGSILNGYSRRSTATWVPEDETARSQGGKSKRRPGLEITDTYRRIHGTPAPGAMLYTLNGRTLNATGEFSGDAFLVHAGAEAMNRASNLHSGYLKVRKNLQEEGIFEPSEDPKKLILTRHTVFNGVSEAASVLWGSPRNGRVAWSNHIGATLGPLPGRTSLVRTLVQAAAHLRKAAKELELNPDDGAAPWARFLNTTSELIEKHRIPNSKPDLDINLASLLQAIGSAEPPPSASAETQMFWQAGFHACAKQLVTLLSGGPAAGSSKPRF